MDTQNLRTGADVLAVVSAKRVPLSVAAVTALLILIIVLAGHPILFSLLLGPLVLGGIATLINNTGLNSWIDAQRGTYDRMEAWSAGRDGKLAKYFARPVARGSTWVWTRSEDVPNVALRSGARVAAVLYLWSAMLGLLAAALYIVVAIVALMLMIALVGWILSVTGASDDEPRHSSRGDRESLLGAGLRSGTRIFRKTGIFSEDEVGRVDASGRIYERTGIFSEDQVGRVDEEGLVHERTGLFSEDQSHRVDDQGRIYKKTGVFSEEEVGRIDDDGRIYRKTGVFSEEQIGRIEDA